MDPTGLFPPDETVADDGFNPLSNATSLPVMVPQPHPAVYPGHHRGVIFTYSAPSSHYQISELVSPYAADVQQGPPYASPTPYLALSSDSSPPSTVTPSRHRASRLYEPGSLDQSDLIIREEITHPYSRLYSKKKEMITRKTHKLWNLSLEKKILAPQEISTMSAPSRRVIYTASLEAHIDRLHEQLANYSLSAVDPQALTHHHGLHVKTAKNMISGLQHDLTELELKILEIGRANKGLEEGRTQT